MGLRLKRVIGTSAAIATVATIAPFIGSSVALAATNNGTVDLLPSSGDSNTTFDMVAGSGANPFACNGDSVTGGYNWSTFLMPASGDENELQFDGLGPTGTSEPGTISLIGSDGDPKVAESTNLAGSDGKGIFAPGAYNFSLFLPGEIPAGVYKIGVACTTAGGSSLDTFWSRTVTVTADAAGGPAEITWGVGAAAAAPANVVATPQDGALSVSFDEVTADPEVSTYTATATPAGGGTPVSQTGSGSPIVISGLTNGTLYDVVVSADNGVGAPAESAPVQGTPGISNTAPVVTATPGFGEATVTWTPAGGSPTGYEVTISPDPTSGPYSVTVPVADPREVTITGLDPAVLYTVSVEALYADPGESAPVGTDQVQVIDNSAIIQTIQAERPEGEFVLSQDCPTVDCLVVLDPAVLDADAEYYVATGELHPISVLDTRDTDNGWTVNANIADEFESTGDAFSAEALGFAPEVLDDSEPLGNGYDQVVTAGDVIAPWSSTDLVDGNAVLMDSRPVTATTGGLGFATATALLDLRLPVTASAGTYTAVISFTAA